MSHTIIDVREPSEYSRGHVPGALNITCDRLMAGAAELASLPKDAAITVYCESGGRSDVAVRILSQLGFANVSNGINQAQVRAAQRSKLV